MGPSRILSQLHVQRELFVNRVVASINKSRSVSEYSDRHLADPTSPVAQQRGIEAVPTYRDVCALSANTDTAASSGDGKWPNYDGLASHRGFAAERSGRGRVLIPRLASPKTGEIGW
jgi:hypothetical protein